MMEVFDISARDSKLHALEMQLLEALDSLVPDRLSIHDREGTLQVKEALGEVGRRHGLSLYANGVKKHSGGEWLYDLTLCGYSSESAGEGRFVHVELAAECEWRPNPTGDGDFEKLLQTNARHRLWVFYPRHQTVREQFGVCEAMIDHFHDLPAGARFLLSGLEPETYAFAHRLVIK